MQHFMELASTADMNKLALMKIALRRNEINIHTQNEKSVQVIQHGMTLVDSESRAKVFVPFSEYQDAKLVLQEAGFENNLSHEDNASEPFMEFFKKIADRFPVLQDLRIEVQVIIVFFVMALIIVMIAFGVIGLSDGF